MKKIFLFLLINLLFFITVKPAEAHFPKTDGNMTVTLHVDPNDDPSAGEPAHLYFLFKDTTKKFTLSQCNCTISITELGKNTSRQQLIDDKNTKQSIWGASIPYTFPDKNVYHIILTGKPKKANEFQQFTVSWYFRVDTVAPVLQQQRQGPSDIEVLLGAFGVGVIVIVLMGIFIKKEFSHEFQT